MSRIKLPCSTSGGETTSESTALAIAAANARRPRARWPRRAVSFPTARSATLTLFPCSSSILQQVAEHDGAQGEECDVERHQQAEPRAGLPHAPGCGQL